MECTCVRQTDLPNTSKLYADLVYHFDRVQDLYSFPPNDSAALTQASQFAFPDDRRAALVAALRPLNNGNPSLDLLAQSRNGSYRYRPAGRAIRRPGLHGLQGPDGDSPRGRFAGAGHAAVPVFWLATEDHDFAEINHTWVFGADHQPVRLQTGGEAPAGAFPVGGIEVGAFPLDELRAALKGLPFADDAVALGAARLPARCIHGLGIRRNDSRTLRALRPAADRPDDAGAARHSRTFDATRGRAHAVN